MDINEHLLEPTIKPVVDLLDTPVTDTPVSVIATPVVTDPVTSPYKLDETITLITEAYKQYSNQHAISINLKAKGCIDKDTAEFTKEHFKSVREDKRLAIESFTELPSKVNLELTVNLINHDLEETKEVMDTLIKNEFSNDVAVIRNESGIRTILVGALVEHITNITLKGAVNKAIFTNTNTLFYGGDDADSMFNIATSPLTKVRYALPTAQALDTETKELLTDLVKYIDVYNFKVMYYAIKNGVSLNSKQELNMANVCLANVDITLRDVLDIICNKGMASTLLATEAMVESILKDLEATWEPSNATLVTRAELASSLKFLTTYHVDLDNVFDVLEKLLVKLEPVLA